MRILVALLTVLALAAPAYAYISDEGVQITCRAPVGGTWSINIRALAVSDDDSVSEVFVASYDGGLRIDLRPAGDNIWTRRIPDAFCNQIMKWRFLVHDSSGFSSRDVGCGYKVPGVVTCVAGSPVPR